MKTKEKIVQFGKIGGNRNRVLVLGHEVFDSEEEESEASTARKMLDMMKNDYSISQAEYEEISALLKDECTKKEIEEVLSKLFPKLQEE